MFTSDQIQGKKVLLRADLDIDIPSQSEDIDYRIQTLIPTLQACLEHASQVCLIGHRGRPNSYNADLNLQPVAEEIKRLINREIKVFPSGYSPGEWWKGGDPLVLLDNLRFDKREENQDAGFAKELSKGADIYIYEAFATYRPCTSLSLIPKQIPTLTGFQFDKEVKVLGSLLGSGSKPSLLIGSGAKEDKRQILKTLRSKFDHVFFGGVFANKNDLEPDGLDLNSHALVKLDSLINMSQTIVLNGPVGKYEDDSHSKGTKYLLEKLASLNSQKQTIIGGGDTLSAVEKLGFKYTQYGFVSTGGGGMLEFLATGTHPLFSVLN